MAAVGYLCALAVAATLGVAGVAKLGRGRATRASFTAMRLPVPAVLANLVPVVEVGSAILLVVAPRAGAVASGVLLVAFTGVVARAVVRRDTIPCACFGSTGTAPMSVVELARNGLLLAGAGVAAFASAPVTPTLPALVLVGTGVVVGATALALLAMRRDVGAVWKVALAAEPR